MLLLVDIGNTRIKFAASDGVSIGETTAVVHQQCWADALQILDDFLPAQIDDCLVASVVGEHDNELIADILSKYSANPPNFLKTQSFQCGLENAYTDYKSMGVDRWLAMIGARQLHPGPVLVISCGTALTIDLVAADGRHQGGYIIPGILLMQRTLGQNTAKVFFNEDVDLSWQWGKSTTECVSAGSLLANISVIDQSIINAETVFARDLQCFITGGDALKVQGFLRRRVIHQADLVFLGMLAVNAEWENARAK